MEAAAGLADLDARLAFKQLHRELRLTGYYLPGNLFDCH